MIISNLNVHNIRGLNLKAAHDASHGVAGFIGFG